MSARMSAPTNTDARSSALNKAKTEFGELYFRFQLLPAAILFI
jgi:hypothetical protein